MKFTIFGGRGFIGSRLANHLRQKGHEVFLPSRDGENAIGPDLGHVIYAIGLTGDFRNRPFDTVEAHVCFLAKMLPQILYDSFLYLSSTRLYSGLADSFPSKEEIPITLLPSSDNLYDISKLMGEALCLSQQSPKVRVARLSNVFGHDQNRHTFLGEIFTELRSSNEVTIREAPESGKDYIELADVLYLLEAIALSGRDRIYNVASGSLLTHARLADYLTKISGKRVCFLDNAPLRRFPSIDITRIEEEFGFRPRSIQAFLGSMFSTYETSEKGNDS